jgi:hypothetical protein
VLVPQKGMGVQVPPRTHMQLSDLRLSASRYRAGEQRRRSQPWGFKSSRTWLRTCCQPRHVDEPSRCSGARTAAPSPRTGWYKTPARTPRLRSRPSPGAGLPAGRPARRPADGGLMPASGSALHRRAPSRHEHPPDWCLCLLPLPCPRRLGVLRVQVLCLTADSLGCLMTTSKAVGKSVPALRVTGRDNWARSVLAVCLPPWAQPQLPESSAMKTRTSPPAGPPPPPSPPRRTAPAP